MKRAILLQIDATTRKTEVLRGFSDKATAEYKSKLEGVRFRKVSEKDTSKTCALCGQKENGRIHRGLYRCKLYNVVFNADADGALNISKKYLRIPLSKGSGIGVVDALANPAVFHWNEHEWLDETPFLRGSGVR